jgi:hypothetical protein
VYKAFLPKPLVTVSGQQGFHHIGNFSSSKRRANDFAWGRRAA